MTKRRPSTDPAPPGQREEKEDGERKRKSGGRETESLSLWNTPPKKPHQPLYHSVTPARALPLRLFGLFCYWPPEKPD